MDDGRQVEDLSHKSRANVFAALYITKFASTSYFERVGIIIESEEGMLNAISFLGEHGFTWNTRTRRDLKGIIGHSLYRRSIPGTRMA